MSSVTTLFWLLILTLAVVIYAVEAGAATRHRSAILSSMFSTLAAVLYIMFFGVDDSAFDRMALPPDSVGSKGAQQAADAGNGGKGGGDKKAAAASASNESQAQSAAAAGTTARAELAAQAAASSPSDGGGSGSAAVEAGPVVPKGPFADCEDCPSMIAIPTGKFRMGSSEHDPYHQPNENPVHVQIKYPFAVSRFEITREQYGKFSEDTHRTETRGCMVNQKSTSRASWQRPGIEQAGSHPVVCVSWRDAKAYVEWLSKKTGHHYRLLSESEWEYMARGGSDGTFAFGDALSTGRANYNRSRDGTIPVGLMSPNGFGVYDVHGNAWEFVEDCWHADLTFNALDGRPTTLRGDCSQRVTRGGGWASTALQSRSASRTALDSTVTANTVGFRIARTFE